MDTKSQPSDYLWCVLFPLCGYTNIDTLVPEHVKMFVVKAYFRLNLQIQ